MLLCVLYLRVCRVWHQHIACSLYVCVTTGANAVVPSLAVRSASDDHLLSHASIARDDSSTSSLRLDSEDIKNLTKSDDIDTMPHPLCNHDIPEKCISSCWSFDDDTRQCLMADDVDEIERCLSITEQLPVTKNTSSDQCCCQHDEVTDQPNYHQSPVVQAACFSPTLW